MQVRSAHRLSDHGLTQKLPIAGTSVLTACQSSGNVFVAATGSDGIHQLAPVPFDQQAKALADVDQFAEALTMSAYLHDSQVYRRHVAHMPCVMLGTYNLNLTGLDCYTMLHQ